MNLFSYDLIPTQGPNLGLIVLQADQRIEQDFRRLLPGDANLFVTRVPSGSDVTPETLNEMRAHIPAAAELLPGSVDFDVIGYGCTSGTAQIGPEQISGLVQQSRTTRQVSEPVSALVAACAALGLNRLALLSPYVASVSEQLRRVLRANTIETPVFGSFGEAEEARVARIDPASVRQAARRLAGVGQVDAIFLSCTNLNTLDIIAPLEQETGLPVLSSNLVLAWHMCRLAKTPVIRWPGRLAGTTAVSDRTRAGNK